MVWDRPGWERERTELGPYDDIPEHLGQLIRASEARVSAQITALLALTDAGFDTVKAEAALWREMDALNALRQQQWQAFAMRDL